jgi:hypothetical protein
MRFSPKQLYPLKLKLVNTPEGAPSDARKKDARRIV